MGISVAHQSNVFLCSILIGVVLSVLYDMFRVARKEVRHKNIFVMFEDVVFWLLCTAFMFVFMYNINSGQFRVYIIVGAILGCILYYLTISRFVVKVFCIITDIIKKTIKALLKIFIRPFIVIVLRPLNTAGHRVSQKSKKYYRNLKNLYHFKIKTVIIAFRKRKVKKTLARTKKNK